ncbi:antitoxin StbD [Pseudomonas sp. 3296]|uniref:type II toxin-antitoxin system Phd/YefM family antitoxin n=1 Tax=Pseudomonas sp. 3296 TaxID=2817753 RepID=UPI00286795EF|nr:type II toxin-antitoxin system Phd/YefM family antitoxin [Pseudomonas sp. 3296]MDR6919041.1 antitoxin StbD [Pseudomonas sp. 3296]
MQRLLAEKVIGISEFAQNADDVVREAQQEPIAVLENNRIQAYLISADLYGAMLERLDDFDLAALVLARSGEDSVPVSLDAL